MTFIGIRPTEDRLEIVTDSLTAGLGSRYLWDESNLKALPVVEARVVVASTGLVSLGQRWQQHVLSRADGANGIDDVLDRVDPAALDQGSDIPTNLYLAGWSERRGRYAAVAFPSYNAWRPVELGDIHYSRHPDGWQRHDDLPEKLKHWRRRHAPSEARGTVLPSWHGHPPPTDQSEWIMAAHAARRTVTMRAADSRQGRVFEIRPLFGGHLRRLVMTADSLTQDTLCTLDTEDTIAANLRDALIDSSHPVWQRGPCLCGSGVSMADCHLDALYCGPCPCGRSRDFADCCRVGVDPDERHLIPGIRVTTQQGPKLIPWDSPAGRTRQHSCGGQDVDEYSYSHNGRWQGLALCRDCVQVWIPPVLSPANLPPIPGHRIKASHTDGRG